jgi:hypothetical protein
VLRMSPLRVRSWDAEMLLLLTVGPTGWPQTASTGAMCGTVTHQSNAAIVDATVVATNSGTGLTRKAQTMAKGGVQ